MNINHSHFIIVLLLWGHAQLAVAVFLGTAMGKSRLTALVSYMVIVSTVLAGVILSTLQATFSGKWPAVMFFIPNLNFIRSIMIVFTVGEGSMSDSVSEEFWMACGLQLLAGSVFLLSGFLLHVYIINDISSGQVLTYVLETVQRSRSVDLVVQVEGTAECADNDVKAEACRIESDSESEADDGVVVKKLAKQYPGGHLAVRGVSFGIPEGECFGLLGPNGAGKTTVIAMLSGSLSITSGSARVR